MLNRREVSPKAEDDQGSFSEEMTLNMRLRRERGSWSKKERTKESLQTEGPGLKH